jgi:DNA-binding Lrp family transcriptional regulator
LTLPSAAPVAAGERARRAPALATFDYAVLALLRADGATPRPPLALAEAVGAGREEVSAAMRRLCAAGLATRAGSVVYEAEMLMGLAERAAAIARERGGTISLAELRDELQTSRKYAQALLEHLDSNKVMVRTGDRHQLRGAGGGPRSATLGRQGSGGPAGLQSQ